MSHMIASFKVGALRGQDAALYATGRGRVKSAWHKLGIHVDVPDLCDDDSLPQEAREMLSALLGDVYKRPLIDSETGEQAFGLEGIYHGGMGLLGYCGGRQRSSWEPGQPREVFGILRRLVSDMGGSIESVQWLTDGSLLIDGMLPDDAQWDGDPHEVRFCAELNFSGRKADRLMVSLTRVVCNNTRSLAVYEANKAGSLIRIRHAGDVAGAWEVDSAELMADYSEKVAEVQKQLFALGKIEVTSEQRAEIFGKLVGEAPPESAHGNAKNRHKATVDAFVHAFRVEQESAKKMGIDPDSARVLYETITRVHSHTDALIRRQDDTRRRIDLLSGAGQRHIDELLVSVGLGDSDALEAACAEFMADMESARTETATDGASILADMLGMD